jgi:hypothetical protein
MMPEINIWRAAQLMLKRYGAQIPRQVIWLPSAAAAASTWW